MAWESIIIVLLAITLLYYYFFSVELLRRKKKGRCLLLLPLYAPYIKAQKQRAASSGFHIIGILGGINTISQGLLWVCYFSFHSGL
jgi:hypothetical protein